MTNRGRPGPWVVHFAPPSSHPMTLAMRSVFSNHSEVPCGIPKVRSTIQVDLLASICDQAID